MSKTGVFNPPNEKHGILKSRIVTVLRRNSNLTVMALKCYIIRVVKAKRILNSKVELFEFYYLSKLK